MVFPVIRVFPVNLGTDILLPLLCSMSLTSPNFDVMSYLYFPNFGQGSFHKIAGKPLHFMSMIFVLVISLTLIILILSIQSLSPSPTALKPCSACRLINPPVLWKIVLIKMKCCIIQHFISLCTVCLVQSIKLLNQKIFFLFLEQNICYGCSKEPSL